MIDCGERFELCNIFIIVNCEVEYNKYTYCACVCQIEMRWLASELFGRNSTCFDNKTIIHSIAVKNTKNCLLVCVFVLISLELFFPWKSWNAFIRLARCELCDFGASWIDSWSDQNNLRLFFSFNYYPFRVYKIGFWFQFLSLFVISYTDNKNLFDTRWFPTLLITVILSSRFSRKCFTRYIIFHLFLELQCDTKLAMVKWMQKILFLITWRISDGRHRFQFTNVTKEPYRNHITMDRVESN